VSVSQIAKRVTRVEEALGSRSDPDRTTFTLEELYRSLWQHDKAKFLEIAQHTQGMLLVPLLEREDAAAAEAKRRSSVKTSSYCSRFKQRAAAKADPA